MSISNSKNAVDGMLLVLPRCSLFIYVATPVAGKPRFPARSVVSINVKLHPASHIGEKLDGKRGILSCKARQTH